MPLEQRKKPPGDPYPAWKLFSKAQAPTGKAAPSRPVQTNPHHAQETWGPACTLAGVGSQEFQIQQPGMCGCVGGGGGARGGGGVQCTYPPESCSQEKEKVMGLEPNAALREESESSHRTQGRGWCAGVSPAPSVGEARRWAPAPRQQTSCHHSPPPTQGHAVQSGCAK